jgi:DNA-binding transcriptional regulator YdaS (Cro superfamily)
MTPQDVMTHYGTAGRAAEKLGVSVETVYQWSKRGYVPAGRQALIQIATRGRLRVSKRRSR